MIDKDKNYKKRLKFIQIYEDFNKEIPEDLISLFKQIKKKIGKKEGSFTYLLNLNEFNFIDLNINLVVNFIKLESNKDYSEQEIVYYSNINLGELLQNKDVIDIPIFIEDTSLNNDKLYSVISHEIRHIYDFYTISEESDYKSFIGSLNYTYLKNKVSDDFMYFMGLVYLSLEHELVARNTMIYENFINCKSSKEVLYNRYKKTYMYKSLMQLKNFDYTNFINLKYLHDINLFVGKFGEKECENINNIENFFYGWKQYFEDKSDEYLKEGYKILDKVYNVIKENNNKKEVRNVVDILKDIYKKYIK